MNGKTITLHIAPTVTLSLQIASVLCSIKTPFQEIVVADSNYFGRMLLIDGIIQFTERDYRIYHEMIVHPALCRASRAEKVLIIGGGDLLAAKECLKYAPVDVTVVDVDPAVTEVVQRYFERLLDGLDSSSGVKILNTDGYEFLRKSGNKFDVIIVDSTDFRPFGASQTLFSYEFYYCCSTALAEGGVLVAQHGVPFLARRNFQQVQTAIGRAFPNTFAYDFSVPSFFGGATVCTLAGCLPVLDTLLRKPVGLVHADSRKIQLLQRYRSEDAMVRDRVQRRAPEN